MYGWEIVPSSGTVSNQYRKANLFVDVVPTQPQHFFTVLQRLGPLSGGSL